MTKAEKREYAKKYRAKREKEGKKKGVKKTKGTPRFHIVDSTDLQNALKTTEAHRGLLQVADELISKLGTVVSLSEQIGRQMTLPHLGIGAVRTKKTPKGKK